MITLNHKIMQLKNYFLFTTLVFFGVVSKSYGQDVDNTFTGFQAGLNNTGNFNSGYGKNSLNQNSSHHNSAFGYSTLTVTSGGFNNAFGDSALSTNNTGSLNSAFGTSSLFNNKTGSRNIAIGHRSLEANIIGSGNTAIGCASLLRNVGNFNIALGYQTPRHLLTGNSNIFIGVETGANLLHGSSNVFIGKVILSGAPSTTIVAGNDTNKTIILADGSGNQRLFIERNGNVGIGLGNNIIPKNKLDVGGGIVIGKNYTPNLFSDTSLSPIAPANGMLVEGKVGIGNIAPNNKVEITQGTTGNSGLRFTNLTSTFNPTTTATVTKFLSVNASGDVVLEKMPSLTSSNILSSNVNIMTSNVNNITTTASIVNSISNSINASNQLITTVNGIESAPVVLPNQNFTEIDASVTNELQILSQSGNTISLSNGGGSFVLPTFTDTDTDAQSLTLTGNNLSISNGNSVTLPIFTEVDASVTNELQTLSQAGNTVTLSNGGGSFVLPTFTEVDASVTNELQTLSQSGNTVTLSNGGGTFVLPTFTDTDAQALTLTGNNLSISNGNSVTLPTFTEVDGSVTNELQTISQTGNIVTLSNGGGSFTLPTTSVVAGTNVTVTGNGSNASPFQVNANDTSLYANNGVINQATTTNNNRIVDMNNRNIWFSTANSTSNGKIYMGSNATYPNTTGDYQLFVEGGILTEKVKVALRSTANWADYVFADTYKLMPLQEVEKFVSKNKHLPGVDSASQLVKNGIDIAEMQSKQMEKIEELTLYAIDQNKAIEKQNKEIEELKLQIKMLIEKTK